MTEATAREGDEAMGDKVVILRCDLIELKQLVGIVHDMQEAKETLPLLGRIEDALAASPPPSAGGEVTEEMVKAARLAGGYSDHIVHSIHGSTIRKMLEAAFRSHTSLQSSSLEIESRDRSEACSFRKYTLDVLDRRNAIIASLQSEVEMAHELVGQKSEQYIAARKEADKLQSEVERLKRALKAISHNDPCLGNGKTSGDIARKALETMG